MSAPVNDNFANATDLGSAGSGYTFGTNTDATTESGEPAEWLYNPTNSQGWNPSTYPPNPDWTAGPKNTVWYKWTCPATDDYFFTTKEFNLTIAAQYTNFFSVIQAFTANSTPPVVGDLTETNYILNQSAGWGNLQLGSAVAFTGTAGKVYYIRIDGRGNHLPGPQGNFFLSWKPYIGKQLGSCAGCALDITAEQCVGTTQISSGLAVAGEDQYYPFGVFPTSAGYYRVKICGGAMYNLEAEGLGNSTPFFKISYNSGRNKAVYRGATDIINMSDSRRQPTFSSAEFRCGISSVFCGTGEEIGIHWTWEQYFKSWDWSDPSKPNVKDLPCYMYDDYAIHGDNPIYRIQQPETFNFIQTTINSQPGSTIFYNGYFVSTSQSTLSNPSYQLVYTPITIDMLSPVTGPTGSTCSVGSDGGNNWHAIFTVRNVSQHDWPNMSVRLLNTGGITGAAVTGIPFSMNAQSQGNTGQFSFSADPLSGPITATLEFSLCGVVFGTLAFPIYPIVTFGITPKSIETNCSGTKFWRFSIDNTYQASPCVWPGSNQATWLKETITATDVLTGTPLLIISNASCVTQSTTFIGAPIQSWTIAIQAQSTARQVLVTVQPQYQPFAGGSYINLPPFQKTITVPAA